jgi:hypothetical protein
MKKDIHAVIDSLDSRHVDATPLLHALADGKPVKAADIAELHSRFSQVAPVLSALADGKPVTQKQIDELDSFTGTRLRTILSELASGRKQPARKAKKKAKKRKAAKKR